MLPGEGFAAVCKPKVVELSTDIASFTRILDGLSEIRWGQGAAKEGTGHSRSEGRSAAAVRPAPAWPQIHPGLAVTYEKRALPVTHAMQSPPRDARADRFGPRGWFTSLVYLPFTVFSRCVTVGSECGRCATMVSTELALRACDRGELSDAQVRVVAHRDARPVHLPHPSLWISAALAMVTRACARHPSCSEQARVFVQPRYTSGSGIHKSADHRHPSIALARCDGPASCSPWYPSLSWTVPSGAAPARRPPHTSHAARGDHQSALHRRPTHRPSARLCPERERSR